MMTCKAVWLLAALVALAEDPAEPPAEWQRLTEAAARAEKAGDGAAAEALLLQVIAESDKLGPDDLLRADPLDQLGAFYLAKKRKRYDEAEPLFRRALALREQVQGPEHPDVARSLDHLALCRLFLKGEQAQTAGPLFRREAAILEKTRGKDNPEVARPLHGLAMWHLHRKEYAEADELLTRAVALREKALGPDNAAIADLVDDLGDTHAAQVFQLDMAELLAEDKGKPKAETKSERHARQADEFYKRALAIREKALKPDDPDIAESLLNLGQLALMREKPADGERYLDRWLALDDQKKAPANEQRAKVSTMLAYASTEQKDWAECDRRLARALTVVEEVHGAESDEAAAVVSLQAHVALDAGRFDDAERFLKRGLEIQEASIGSDDPDVKRASVLMGGRYQDHAGDAKSPDLWRRLRALAEQSGRKDHHDALSDILKNYADLLRRTNRVVPRPTEEDLAFLKQNGIVISLADLDDLDTVNHLFEEEKLDDGSLEHIERLYDLEFLNLSSGLHGERRTITDAGLAHLKGLTSLRRLALSGTRITDAGLAHLAGMKHLDDLVLSFTRVGDAGLAHLEGLKHLHKLSLAYTNVTDAGLEHLGGLKNLRSLDLSSTKVTQTAVDRLRRARPDLKIEYRPGEGFVPVPRTEVGPLFSFPGLRRRQKSDAPAAEAVTPPAEAVLPPVDELVPPAPPIPF